MCEENNSFPKESRKPEKVKQKIAYDIDKAIIISKV